MFGGFSFARRFSPYLSTPPATTTVTFTAAPISSPSPDPEAGLEDDSKITLSNGSVEVKIDPELLKEASCVIKDLLEGDLEAKTITLEDIDDETLNFLLKLVEATPSIQEISNNANFNSFLDANHITRSEIFPYLSNFLLAMEKYDILAFKKFFDTLLDTTFLSTYRSYCNLMEAMEETLPEAQSSAYKLKVQEINQKNFYRISYSSLRFWPANVVTDMLNEYPNTLEAFSREQWNLAKKYAGIYKFAMQDGQNSLMQALNEKLQTAPQWFNARILQLLAKSHN